ncbi:CHAT domain-containing protein [Ilyonectria robusta]|uniref:CHAT domain-containing protein n=1 Tax=Ilyonectria robusta TaxID=1079257 RepID=UPI001E8D49ED|nr:CHAT domain-containing protein [Ilyonectria robusta]KAH8667156.1 CHAT domain-containing protein [Ilyonectria robusta]
MRGGYYAKYSRTGAMEDLDLAIQLYQECLSTTPRDHSDWASLLDSLGDGYYHRYSRTEAMPDLEKAVQRFRESLDTPPSHPPDQMSRLAEVRAKYSEQYPETTEYQAHLNRALQLYQESLANTPEHHHDRTPRLSNLGVGFYLKYCVTRDAMYLDRATELFQQCLDTTPMDHPDRALRLYKLGAIHEARYQETESVEDINTEIRYLEECLDRLPNDDSHRPSCLRALGMGRYRRYQELNTLTDLDTSIELFQESLRATSMDHPDRASRLYDLGAGYHDRYNETRTETDLDKAIELFEESLENTPTHYHDQTSRIRSLGQAYRIRYLKRDTATDLDKAICLFEKFLEQIPTDHSDRATRLNDLAAVYNDRYQKNDIRSDLDKAILLLREALNHSQSPTPDRLVAGKILLYIHAELEAWEEAHEFAKTAVHLIPSVVPRLLGAAHKQSLLSQDAGLASDATAVTLNAGKHAFDAVQLLEIGRGVISGLFYEMAADVAKLLSAYPALGERFIKLKEQLEVPAASNPTQAMKQQDLRESLPSLVDRLEGLDPAPQTPAEQSYIGSQLDKLIVEIRKQPGFENFLLASSEEEIRAAARHGPIVAINVSELRCDAILIERHRIWSLCLPLLNLDEIQLKTQQSSLDSPETLEWLWDVVASPVLEALGYTQSPADDCWPHVWWIPTGPLSHFPLHAAGYHYKRSSESVLDRVMSSYSTSIKAIICGRQRRPQQFALSQALLLGMEYTPGHSRLPFATQEIAMLRDLFKSMPVEPVELGHSKEDVTSRLLNCSVFHFAGHGYTDKAKPSNSRLVLEGIPLTVGDLLEMNLYDHSPFLAYLSACSTGQIKDDKFIDESIHLISAFQMAGFRHVIGTLWEVNDEHCVDIARYTYEGMRDRGMTDESVCYGLHMATRTLRDNWLGTPAEPNRKLSGTDLGTGLARERRQLSRDVLLCDDDEELGRVHWVPYIHFGV